VDSQMPRTWDTCTVPESDLSCPSTWSHSGPCLILSKHGEPRVYSCSDIQTIGCRWIPVCGPMRQRQLDLCFRCHTTSPVLFAGKATSTTTTEYCKTCCVCVLTIVSFMKNEWYHRSLFEFVHVDDLDKVKEQLTSQEATTSNRVLDLKTGTVKKDSSSSKCNM
jgi:hypothetical protein